MVAAALGRAGLAVVVILNWSETEAVVVAVGGAAVPVLLVVAVVVAELVITPVSVTQVLVSARTAVIMWQSPVSVGVFESKIISKPYVYRC